MSYWLAITPDSTPYACLSAENVLSALHAERFSQPRRGGGFCVAALSKPWTHPDGDIRSRLQQYPYVGFPVAFGRLPTHGEVGDWANFEEKWMQRIDPAYVGERPIRTFAPLLRFISPVRGGFTKMDLLDRTRSFVGGWCDVAF